MFRTAREAPPTTCATRPAGSRSRRRRFDNFGKINLKRGHRVVELVLKYVLLGQRITTESHGTERRTGASGRRHRRAARAARPCPPFAAIRGYTSEDPQAEAPMLRALMFRLPSSLVVAGGTPTWQRPRAPRPPTACWRAGWNCIRPAIYSAPSTPTRRSLALEPGSGRRALESGRGLRPARTVRRRDPAVLGSAEGRFDQHRHPPEPRTRLLQVGAPAARHSRAQAGRGVGAPGEERLPRARRLLPAGRSGSRGHRAAAAARVDVRERPRVRVSARHRVASHRQPGRRPEIRRPRVRRRRVG